MKKTKVYHLNRSAIQTFVLKMKSLWKLSWNYVYLLLWYPTCMTNENIKICYDIDCFGMKFQCYAMRYKCYDMLWCQWFKNMFELTVKCSIFPP